MLCPRSRESSELPRIAVASKDRSTVDITRLQIKDCWGGLAVYQKKPEFGPGKMTVNDIKQENIQYSPLVEQGSQMKIDGKTIPPNTKNLAKQLYKTEEDIK